MSGLRLLAIVSGLLATGPVAWAQNVSLPALLKTLYPGYEARGGTIGRDWKVMEAQFLPFQHYSVLLVMRASLDEQGRPALCGACPRLLDGALVGPSGEVMSFVPELLKLDGHSRLSIAEDDFLESPRGGLLGLKVEHSNQGVEHSDLYLIDSRPPLQVALQVRTFFSDCGGVGDLEAGKQELRTEIVYREEGAYPLILRQRQLDCQGRLLAEQDVPLSWDSSRRRYQPAQPRQ